MLKAVPRVRPFVGWISGERAENITITISMKWMMTKEEGDVWMLVCPMMDLEYVPIAANGDRFLPETVSVALSRPESLLQRRLYGKTP